MSQTADQTDTVYDFLKDGKTFEEALRTRTFEPDPPNFTPRISSLLRVENHVMCYQMSILKSNNGNDESCQRFFFDYPQPVAGKDISCIPIFPTVIRSLPLRENRNG